MLMSHEWMSGEEMASRCAISRTAVWNHILDLKHRGYDIESCHKRGYKLHQIPQQLFPELIRYQLNTKNIGRKIIHYTFIGSTNTEAFKMGLNGEENGTVVIAENQTAGKGRYNRKWESYQGKSILCSLLIRPENHKPRDVYQFTMIAAVSVADAISTVAQIAPAIKWPNDIYIENRKIAGILTEMNGEMDQITFLIIGIGINVNQNESEFYPVLTDAGSLDMFAKKSVSRLTLIKCLLEKFDMYCDLLTKGAFSSVYGLWIKYCNSIGKQISFSSGNLIGTGIITGIRQDGGLEVMTADKKQVTLYSGDIRIL